jgi:dipeptidyl aminopeptidase/acylaminoacyl peptidase
MKSPLVIQTHGWNPERFWVNGPYSTAFAAQPLAGAGIIVLQVELETSSISTREECDEEQSLYEGAIDYLNRLGMIDIDRVGVIGFSRTGLTVKCTLVRSKYHFAAATVADGSDGGYFAYLASLNSFPQVSLDSERVNAGTPFGDGLSKWLRNSPGFNLEEVNTPIRLEANGAASLLYAWEWFTGLLRLNKPIELIYQPDADHVLVKPSEWLTSEQGNVDWFVFWLKGAEDTSPSKAGQYARWRELRKLEITGVR